MDGLIAGDDRLGAIGITLTYSILRFANFALWRADQLGRLSRARWRRARLSLSNLTQPSACSRSAGRCRCGHVAIVLTGAGTVSDVLLGCRALGRLDHHHGDGEFGAALTLCSLLEFTFTTAGLLH
jgi:branched-chain amino acid transport system permease protein